MSPTVRTKQRLAAMFVALTAGLFAVGGRLVYVQALAADRFSSLAADQRERIVVLSPQRGSIFESGGAELAISRGMTTIFANPHFVSEPRASAAALAPILGVPEPVLLDKLSRESGFVYLTRKTPAETADAVRALRLPGVDFVSESKRFYPAGTLGAHLLGFVGLDNEGLGGVEVRFDKALSGTPGEMFLETDPGGHSIPSGKFRLDPPVPGDDLVLTIDREIQHVAEVALAAAVEKWSARAGSAIVLDPRTGDILAMANLPTFDPNDFAAAKPDARRNRAVVDVYEPGSANKVVTAAAALETGVKLPDDMMTVPDSLKVGNKTFHDAHPHGVLQISFAEVIERSSNIGTIKVAQELGKQRLHEYLKRFGYGRATGLGLPGEASGLLPHPDGWWSTSLPTIAIGQGVAVTAIQITGVYATVANGGVAVAPRILKSTIDHEGREHSAPTSSTRRVITAETAAVLTDILVRVTEGSHGTGEQAAVPGYRVAGKTGTAQKPSPAGGYSGYVGSFIGFAPAERPALVVAVILDDPRPIWGGVTAAPAFKEIMQFSLRHLGIGPGSVLPAEGTPLPAPDRSGGVEPPGAFAVD